MIASYATHSSSYSALVANYATYVLSNSTQTCKPKGPLRNYVTLLGGGGRWPKDYIRLQGGGINMVQPYYRQIIKENPDFNEKNNFFGLKFKQKSISWEDAIR